MPAKKGIFYHSTNIKNVQKIKKHGLKPRKSKTGQWKGRKLFLFGDKRQAKKWQKHRPNNNVLLQIKTSPKRTKYHREFLPPHYTTTKKIAPKDIRIVEVRRKVRRKR